MPFVEYISPRSTLTGPYKSSLATQLLAVDGVSSVFLGSDYITVTKDSGAHWAHVKPEVFSLITLVVSKGEPMVVVNQQQQQLQGDGGDASSTVANAAVYRDEDAEIVAMINELLETRIRPAIQEDGGDIEFRGFEDGVVLLKLRGACRTCDSSTVTLRNGIESMMRHYIPEVREVKQVLDPEEDVAIREFARFEEKLRQQQAGHYPSESGNG